PAVQVAFLGGAGKLVTSRRALDRAFARRERLEDRIEALHHILLAADHHAVAALEPVHAAARTGVGVVDVLAGERLRTPDVVLEERVTAVDDRVAGLELLAELLHGRFGWPARRHHDPYRARLGEPGDQVAQRARPLRAFARELLHGIRAAIVDDALVAVAHQAARHVGAHPTKSDHSELHVSVLSLAGELRSRRGDDLVGREPELRLQFLERRRCAERVHRDLRALAPDVALPAERRGLLDRDARGDVRRQHARAVRIVLGLEQLPRRHADDARPHAARDELLVRRYAQ